MSDFKFKPAPKLRIVLDKNGEITEDSWSKMMNYYEDYNEYERRAATLGPNLREIDKRAKELKAEADQERKERMEMRKKVEELLKQDSCCQCKIKATEMRGKRVLRKDFPNVWICQKCAKRVCKKCGAPLTSVPGLDWIDEEKMEILHSPIHPINPKCVDDC